MKRIDKFANINENVHTLHYENDEAYEHNSIS